MIPLEKQRCQKASCVFFQPFTRKRRVNCPFTVPNDGFRDGSIWMFLKTLFCLVDGSTRAPDSKLAKRSSTWKSWYLGMGVLMSAGGSFNLQKQTTFRLLNSAGVGRLGSKALQNLRDAQGCSTPWKGLDSTQWNFCWRKGQIPRLLGSDDIVFAGVSLCLRCYNFVLLCFVLFNFVFFGFCVVFPSLAMFC